MLIYNEVISSNESSINKVLKTIFFTKPIYYQKKFEVFFKNKLRIILFKNFLILIIKVYNSIIKHN